MQASKGPKDLVRHPQIETVESRTLMTAQPVGDFHLDYSIDDLQSQIDTQAVAGDSFTGLASAFAAYGFSGTGQTVAVIDTGIAYDHKALGGGFGSQYRVVGGWDFTEENDANPYDDGPAGSHGTHVAGIIGSTDATSGGVASGVDLVGLRIFNDAGVGYFSWVEKALQWVHQNRNSFENPITTVNLSIGSTWNSTTVPAWSTIEDELAQLKADGIFISVAAGNSFATYNAAGLSYPAASSSVVPVSSVDADGNLSYYSQRQDRVIAAPGRNIRSTVPDYVGNFNFKTDDFATYSGTSMAAPFVAGASVLLREAMQFVGMTNINQDAIYNIMRSTADAVFDPATGRSYSRLNVGRALDSIMPVDEYGSTATSAYNLGSLTTRTFAGVVGKLDDRDYFTFTATDTGIAKFTGTITGEMRAGWELVGGTGTLSADASSFTFDVVAGRTYTVGISTQAGLGRYSVTASITSTMINLGTVDARLVGGMSLGPGDHWYSVRATRDGILTTEALFTHAGGNIDLAIYNANNQLIASSAGVSNGERLDLTVRAGDQFFVCLRGANSRVDLRLTNLVTQVGTQITVAGTAANDAISLTAGTTNVLSVNGVTYAFSAASARSFIVTGGGGSDSFTFTGTPADDRAVLSPTMAQVTSTNYQVSASGFSLITLYSGRGNDTLTVYDSAGNDEFVAHLSVMRMAGAGYMNYAYGFRSVTAYSTLGGQDGAYLYDTIGDDLFVASPRASAMSGANYRLAANGFFINEGRAANGGFDSAILSDSAADDFLQAAPDMVKLWNSGFSTSARTFESVQAQSGAGGSDRADFFDSALDDIFTATPTSSLIQFGTGRRVVANQFRSVNAQSSAGGSDRANLVGATSNVNLTASGNTAVMRGLQFSNTARGFSQVSATGGSAVNLIDKDSVDFLFQVVGVWQNAS